MRTQTETERLELATRSLVDAGIRAPKITLVLSSGLREFGACLGGATEIPFAQVPNWPVPRVSGHGANLIVGELEGIRVACLTGRAHLYEGWEAHDVVRPVRTLRLLGASVFVLTNAAGGIADGMRAGDLMAITDHLNLTGHSPLRGVHEEVLGPRFPDQTAVYVRRLRRTGLGRFQGASQSGLRHCCRTPGGGNDPAGSRRQGGD